MFKQIIRSSLCLSLVLASCFASAKVSNGEKFGEWEGSCQGQECIVGQIAKLNGQPAGRVMIQKSNDQGYIALVTLHLGLQIDLMQGLGVAIDGKQIGRPPFDFCPSEGCNVFIKLNADNLAKLKKGNKLQLEFFSVGGKNKRINMDFSLSGITKALEAL